MHLSFICFYFYFAGLPVFDYSEKPLDPRKERKKKEPLASESQAGGNLPSVVLNAHVVFLLLEHYSPWGSQKSQTRLSN